MQHTFAGQALDIGWVVDNKFPSRDEYRKMIIKKTGWYSGKGPCQCGALIAGASETELDIIGSFGEAIGIGFQVRDDLLNLIEKSENEAPRAGSGGYGKERGGDIAEGKRTLITIELLERLSEPNSARARDILLQSRETVSNSDIDWFIAKAESTGALDAVSNYCCEHVKFASSALNKLPENYGVVTPSFSKSLTTRLLMLSRPLASVALTLSRSFASSPASWTPPAQSWPGILTVPE